MGFSGFSIFSGFSALSGFSAFSTLGALLGRAAPVPHDDRAKDRGPYMRTVRLALRYPGTTLALAATGTVVWSLGFVMAGASLLVLTDLLSRTMAAPAELPIGIVTAVMGGPFFLWLLIWRTRP